MGGSGGRAGAGRRHRLARHVRPGRPARILRAGADRGRADRSGPRGTVTADRPALRMSPLPPFLADPALQKVLAALPEARIVGGAVRDALAGREVADIDLATPR